MTDLDRFETRLMTWMGARADLATRPFDAAVVARAAASGQARRHGLRPRSLAPRSARVVIALLLLAILAATAALVGSQLLAPSPAPVVPAAHGTFTMTGPMATGREQPSATLLRDGRVLVIGGYPKVAPAEIWDPATGTFSPAGALAHARWAHTATLLDDGRVLVVGGQGVEGDPDAAGLLTVAEIWDPVSLSFSPLSSPSLSRFKGTAELRPDGRVLISGGQSGYRTAEVWDPATEAFGPAATELTPRPDGTLLADGRVLVADRADARVWDPVSATSESAGALYRARSYGSTATLLLDGRVLLIGGDDAPDSAGIWDPTSMTSHATGAPVVPRARHTAVLLADGRVLILGNNFREADYGSAELFELR